MEIPFKFQLNLDADCKMDDDLISQMCALISDTVKPIMKESKNKETMFEITNDKFSILCVPHYCLETIKSEIIKTDFSTTYQDELYHFDLNFTSEEVTENDCSDLVFSLNLRMAK